MGLLILQQAAERAKRSSPDPVGLNWREFCEDGSDYDIDPEDYETEEEYLAALTAACCTWQDG